jgi:uncharacterized membrane protein
MIAQILVIGTVIGLTAWYMQHRFRRWRRLPLARDDAVRAEIAQRANGLEVLARRYARGEIDRVEYLRKKGDIVGAQVPVESTSRRHRLSATKA